MSLKGKNLTLACFHGMNFKAKSWALFIMHEPYIIFATESQQLPEGGRYTIVYHVYLKKKKRLKYEVDFINFYFMLCCLC